MAYTRIEIALPNELKDKLKSLQHIHNTDENGLILKLIRNEIAVMDIKSQKETKEAYEIIEHMAKRVYEVAGKEALQMLAKNVQLLAIHIIEDTMSTSF